MDKIEPRGFVYALQFLLILSTYDAISIPVIRFSIADIAVISAVLMLGLTVNGLRCSINFVLFFSPLFLILNAIIYLHFIIGNNAQFYPELIYSGFVRPLLYILLSINIYFGLKNNRVSSAELMRIVSFCGLVLTIIVLLQYFGFWPPHYHNNPSFGEVGKWTVFSEGFRPTGLTNEASFIGIFLILIASLQISILNSDFKYKNSIYRFSPYITMIGCYFTTSRISLLIGATIFVFYGSNRLRLFTMLFILFVMTIGPQEVAGRMSNLFSFEGDASTIERYGSFFAYGNALFSGDYFWGTGYLNGAGATTKFLDPLVINVLGDRSLPSFSLPLQLLVEMGVPVTILLFFLLSKFRYLQSPPLVAVFLCSMVTGIQNFIFVYLFVSISLYETYSRNQQ